MSDLIEPDYEAAADSRDLETGGIAVGLGQDTRGTLDESIAATLKRDVTQINSRLKQVVYPHFPFGNAAVQTETGETLSGSTSDSADLWAPLCFSILYALALSRGKSLFSSIFVLAWAALLAMGIHLKVSKGRVAAQNSLFANISGCGYCIFPQVLCVVLSIYLYPVVARPLPISGARSFVVTFLRLVTFALCSVWSCKAAFVVTGAQDAVERYPLILILAGLAWLPVVL
ncbi:LAMI_0D07668g1_1 [Lachancea mirantina]|uniref:LAMI_0D07668g1_1 n=1 Tax=Lachancea mirantina TaxID=1230905 RepID=A0A1G4JCF4_9SACH|nr:LAMI_0D07668g1_1 [Lachancea mirantina]